jgi:hypothetical protein
MATTSSRHICKLGLAVNHVAMRQTSYLVGSSRVGTPAPSKNIMVA